MPSVIKPDVYLIFGNGWISSQIREILEAQGKTVIVSKTRTENREQVLTELNELNDRGVVHVFNCAGLRGTPNADWCEDHSIEVTRSNILGALNVMRVYPNVLILRLRGPMAADLDPKNLVTRLMKYERLINIPSSVSVLSNLLPGAVLMAAHGVTGVFNLVNPGPCTNNDIMERAREHIRPGLAWENFAVADMNRVLRAPRANVTLDAGKLVRQCRELGYEIKNSHEALDDMFLEMKKKGL
ncbi:NRS/ER [Apiospora kogelbergensis]|uniref:NRS/ER n=1 Tax=Apiospora kogelbergensis TaxID=1337665 RepID=UPI00312D0DFA